MIYTSQPQCIETYIIHCDRRQHFVLCYITIVKAFLINFYVYFYRTRRVANNQIDHKPYVITAECPGNIAECELPIIGLVWVPRHEIYNRSEHT